MANKEDFPVFCGRVVNVPAIIETRGETHTCIDYLPVNSELTEE